ncbi:MAG: type II secretion system F family protein [Clostridiales Family XIII bacterium]|jgi:type IV pilus assembly protein PilC|nr:type II secretion system F family protein [Clostridiales Family XIII bacterium]
MGETKKETKQQYLASEELAAFNAQLALTVKTGIPLAEGLMILIEEAQTGLGRDILKQVLETIELGDSLANALRGAKVFPVYMTQMIEIGEASGRLDQVLDSLSAYYSRDDNLKKSVKSAITYPAIMLVILVAIILIMIIKVLPIFNEVFNSLGGEMNNIALGAMALGDVISKYSVALVIIIVALIIVAIILSRISSGRQFLMKMVQKIFGKLTDKIAQSKFSSGMSLMLASGLDVDRSVELIEPMVDNEGMKKKVEALRTKINAGEAFSTAVVDTGVFTGIQARMLALGFKSGNLDTVMNKIADDYQSEVDDRLDNLISIIEPTMVAILCIIVGLILLSAMLPLLGVMASLI